MATYQITVASGNLYGGGTGNVYYIDGARNSAGPGNFNWNTDTVLRFDQSDSSNDGHPLLFSTSTVTGGIISSGVTYYLDGSSNQSDYMNSTTFNAASERYIEIDLTDTTANFYYLCWYHGIGMGGVMQKNSDKTYTTTVASGTLYVSGGTGNVFYLDSVRDMDVKWVEDGTLRFNQDDNTNDGHPLLFSANTSPVSPISSGVNYWLDGPSNLSDYSNITKFNAATERYVEIAPASSSDFHYYCYVHGIGMGGAIDVTQDTWGAGNWSANLWGISEAFTSGWGVDAWGTGGSWGQANDESVSLTGLSASIGLGTVISGAQQGWGRGEWGEEPWGESNNPVVTLSGLEATSSVGSPTTIEEVNAGWGSDGWGVENWGSSGVSVLLTGVEATTGLGEDVSWGKQTWGSNVTGWGGEYFLIPEDVMGLTGLGATSSVGTPTAISDATFSLTGQSATSSVGAITPADVMGLTGLGSTSAVGAITPADVMGLTGLGLTSSLGTPEVSGANVVSVTGVSATSSVGGLTPADVMGLTGVSSTSSVGTLTPADVMGLTGVSATASVGTLAALGYKSIKGTQSAGYSSVTATQTANYTAVNADN